MGGPVNHVKHLCSFGKLPVSAAYFGSMFATMNQLCSNLWQDHNFNHSSRHYGHRVDGNRSDFNTLTMKFSHVFAVFIFFSVFHYCGVLLIMLNTCVHLEDFLLLLLILVQCLQHCTWLLL